MNQEPDPIAQILRPLASEAWSPGEHRERLRLALEGSPRARSRWTVLWSALAGGLMAAALLAATGGARFLQRIFGIEVLDIERDAQGNIERITVRTDDATQLQLRPLSATDEFATPVVVTLPHRNGGEVRVRVLRDSELAVLPRYVPVADSPGRAVAPGAQYALREIPCPWTISVTAEALTLHAVEGARTCILPRIATAPGTLPRYGDARGLLEVLDP